MTDIDLPATLESLKAIAAAQAARWPQYAGHFDSYRLVRVKRDIKTKMGLAFARGEIAIGIERSPTYPLVDRLGRFVTVWSRRNEIDWRQRDRRGVAPMKTKTRIPLCYCSRCNDKTPHWYDRVFYAFFCSVCDDSPRNTTKDQS